MYRLTRIHTLSTQGFILQYPGLCIHKLKIYGTEIVSTDYHDHSTMMANMHATMMVAHTHAHTYTQHTQSCVSVCVFMEMNMLI